MRALAITAVAVGLALAGCGGGREPDRGNEPVLPAAVGEDLAARAATVARQLEAGDTCAAAHAADRLNDALRRAIADGDVPERLRVEIQPPVERLVNEVNCEEAPPPEEPEEEPPPEEPEEEAATSCDDLEAEKKRLDEEKDALKETVEDEEDRKTREQEIEVEKKRVEEQLKACGEGEGKDD